MLASGKKTFAETGKTSRRSSVSSEESFTASTREYGSRSFAHASVSLCMTTRGRIESKRWRVLRVDWRVPLVNREPSLARVNLTKGDLLLCSRRLQPSHRQKNTSAEQERFIRQRLFPPAARLRASHQHPSSVALRGLRTFKSKSYIAAFATRIFIRSAMSGKL